MNVKVKNTMEKLNVHILHVKIMHPMKNTVVNINVTTIMIMKDCTMLNSVILNADVSSFAIQIKYAVQDV
jgi:hypothetical protein